MWKDAVCHTTADVFFLQRTVVRNPNQWQQEAERKKLVNVTSAAGTIRLYLSANGESAIKVASGRKSGRQSVCSPALRFSSSRSVHPQRPRGTHLELSLAISFEAYPARVRGH